MEFDHTESAVALVGMDGFRLLAAAEVDGELRQLLETTATVLGCPACGARALSKGLRGPPVNGVPSVRHVPVEQLVAALVERRDLRSPAVNVQTHVQHLGLPSFDDGKAFVNDGALLTSWRRWS